MHALVGCGEGGDGDGALLALPHSLRNQLVLQTKVERVGESRMGGMYERYACGMNIHIKVCVKLGCTHLFSDRSFIEER